MLKLNNVIAFPVQPDWWRLQAIELREGLLMAGLQPDSVERVVSHVGGHIGGLSAALSKSEPKISPEVGVLIQKVYDTMLAAMVMDAQRLDALGALK